MPKKSKKSQSDQLWDDTPCYPCVICIQWIYSKPEPEIDWKIAKRNAKTMNHPYCLFAAERQRQILSENVKMLR